MIKIQNANKQKRVNDHTHKLKLIINNIQST